MTLLLSERCKRSSSVSAFTYDEQADTWDEGYYCEPSETPEVSSNCASAEG